MKADMHVVFSNFRSIGWWLVNGQFTQGDLEAIKKSCEVIIEATNRALERGVINDKEAKHG